MSADTQSGKPKLSVVLGTLNRLPQLMSCIPSIRASAAPWHPEIIIVDGGSTDGTAEYLIEQPDITVIWQGTPRGAVAAFNAGFAAATGEYVANLNDDAVCIGPVLAKAVSVLDRRPDAGQIALPFADPRHAPAVHIINVGTPERAYLYANFGVTRRQLGARLGWWGNVCYHYGGDTELSLQIWRAGYQVVSLGPGREYIEHARTQDATRKENNGEGKALGRRWRLWDGTTISNRENGVEST